MKKIHGWCFGSYPSAERSVKKISANVYFDESSLLEDGKMFVPELSISSKTYSYGNTPAKNTTVGLPYDNLFVSPEVCDYDISAGLVTRIHTSCTKKPTEEELL